MWAGSRAILNLKDLLNSHKMAVRATRMMLRMGLLNQFQAMLTTALIATDSETILTIRHGKPRSQLSQRKCCIEYKTVLKR